MSHLNVTMKNKKRKINVAPKTVRDYVQSMIEDLEEKDGKYITIACEQGQAIINNNEILTICVDPTSQSLCIKFKNNESLVLNGINLRKNVNGSVKKNE